MNSEEMQAAYAAEEAEIGLRYPARWKTPKPPLMKKLLPYPEMVPDDQQCCIEAYVSHGQRHGYECNLTVDDVAAEADLPIDSDMDDVDNPEPQPFDLINHPPHYTSSPSGVEVITITEHLNFCIGNAVKYLLRCDLKGDPIADLKKAAWYVERELDRRTRG